MSKDSRCFICYELLDNINILPYQDDYYGENFSIFKNTYIIKTIDNCKFLYFTICNKCIDVYLNKYNRIFYYLKKRELGFK